MGCFGFKPKRASKRKSEPGPETQDGSSVALSGAGVSEDISQEGRPPRSAEDTARAAPLADVVLRRDLTDGEHAVARAHEKNSDKKVRLTTEYLIHEIESLRVELEMRRRELQSLKQDYNQLCDTAEKLERARKKLSEMTARVEDLQAQLDERRESERRLRQELEEARAALSRETCLKELLALRLEEAGFKLRQQEAASA
ncbi:protein Spindly-B-like isoform X2 [Bacillus rossius redtenbacheri]